MPVSSAEIAMMAMMQQQQFAAMQPQHGAYGQADVMAGNAMNTMAGVGKPLAVGALGMMGLTPGAAIMGGAFKAGASAWGAGGGAMGALGGAASGAMAMLPVAGILAGLGAGINFAGGQMMQGAQDQQILNATLSRTFNFQNQYGGRGFTRGESGRIGTQMRQMAGEAGPLGEMASMSELTQLAGQMGQSGMGRGIRDATEFGNKFKELVKTVKHVATELNTSLGAAMEFMQASKSSGMFTSTDQARFARMANQTAIGGGLAISEVTAMANVGSQISRAYGGLGRQGAMGGMRAIGQVGAAMQAGVLSEEDIYNSTGMSGAEGRQAFAANAMSQTGSFLKSGKGRYFMASMAGANGQIDERAAQQYMMGGVGVGDTRGMAGSHLNEVGRASFLRNEGRLRGAVMERFGAMAPAMALMGWASGKGIDINNMDDRAMLFAQRQLGMGRDELDSAVQMAQNAPKIFREQIQTENFAAHGREMEASRKTAGMEGLKRRLEQAKEKITGGLKQAGQDMYNELTNYVDRWLDNWSGTAVEATTGNLAGIWRDTLKGGAKSSQSYHSVFGGGALQRDTEKAISSLGMGGMGGLGTSKQGMTWGQFAGGQTSLLSTVVSKPIADFITGEGAVGDRFRKAGFGDRMDKISKLSGADRDKATQNLLREGDAVRQAVDNPLSGVSIGGKLRTTLLEEYAMGTLGTASGADRTQEFRKVLEREANKGSTEARSLLNRFDKLSDPQDKLRLVAAGENNLDLRQGRSLAAQGEAVGPLAGILAGRSTGGTVSDQDRMMGRLISGRQLSTTKSVLGGQLGGIAGMALGVPGVVIGHLLGKQSGGGGLDALKGDEALGALARSEEGMKLIGGVMSGDADARDKALHMIAEGQGREDDVGLTTRKQLGTGALMLAEYHSANGDPSPSQWADMMDKWKKIDPKGSEGKGLDDLKKMIGGTLVGTAIQWKKNVAEHAASLRSFGRAEQKRVAAMGVMSIDETTGNMVLSSSTKEGLAKMSPTQRIIAQQAASVSAGLIGLEAHAETADDLDVIRRQQGEHQRLLGSMDLAGLTAYSKTFMDQDAAVMVSDANRFKSLARKGGAGQAIGSYFGAGNTRKEQQELRAAWGKGAKGDEEFLRDIVTQGGLANTDAGTALMQNKDLREALKTAHKGGKDYEVGMGRALAAAEGDPKIKEALDKQKYEKSSPQDKMAADMHLIAQNMTPEKIATATANAVSKVQLIAPTPGTPNGPPTPPPAGG